MRNSFRRTAFAATALGVIFSVPAYADGAPAGAGTSPSDDIIVTARRIEERLQDVPISITVLDAQQLADRNIVTAADIAQYTPSLSVNQNFGAENTTFSIRGFVQDIGTAPSVGVYFADVVAPRAGIMGFPQGEGAGAGTLFDLQNIQILKGPQGTLQGRNTTGGSVSMVPQKPTYKLEGYVEGSIGDYGMQRIQAVINVPFNDSVRMRLGVDRQTRDGYLINTSTDQNGALLGPKAFGNLDYLAARASLVIDVTPDIENYTIGSYTLSKTNGNIQKTIAACTSATGAPCSSALGVPAILQLMDQNAKGEGFYDVRGAVPDTFTRNRTWQVINTTTWRATDNLTVKNIVSYGELKASLKEDQFGTAFSSNAAGMPLPSGYYVSYAAIESYPGLPSADQSTITEELRANGHTSHFNYQGGIYIERSNPIGTSGVLNSAGAACMGDPQAGNCLPANPLFGYNPALAGHLSRTFFSDTGVYAQGTYDLTAKLKLTGGIRYTWDRTQDTSSLLDTGTFTGTPGNYTADWAAGLCNRSSDSLPDCSKTTVQKSHAPTWLIDLDYKPNDNVLTYAKYSRGYRTGGVYPGAPTLFQTYAPEKVDAYEVGLKTSFDEVVRGTFNLAGFYNDFHNEQLQIGFQGVGVPPTAAIANLGHSRMYGFEADTTLHLFTGFVVNAAYSYLNTKILNSGSVASLGGASTTFYGYPSFGFDPYGAGPLAGMYHWYLFGGVPNGSPLFLSPQSKLVLTGTYTLPLDKSFGTLSVGATMSYEASQVTAYTSQGFCYSSTFNNTLTGTNPSCNDIARLAPRTLVNLNVDWKRVLDRPLDLAFFVSNLTNKQYYTLVAGTLGGGFESASLGAPRMFGFRAKVHF